MVRPRTIGTFKEPIDRDSAYTLEEFQGRTGLMMSQIRLARAKGLRVIHIGPLKFVRGADFFSYLERMAEKNDAESAAWAKYVADRYPPRS